MSGFKSLRLFLLVAFAVALLMAATLSFAAAAPVGGPELAPAVPQAEPSGTWAPFGNVGSADLNAVDLSTPVNGWIVGNDGSIYRWNGTNWVAETSGVTYTLLSVSIVPGSGADVWAAGLRATIVHRLANGSWQLVEPPVGFTQQLDSIDMVSATDGWAVGDQGSMLHYDGTSWTLQTPVVSVQLHSVAMFSSSEGWAVGNGGEILRYNGAAWQPFTSPTTVDLYHVTWAGPNDAWAVGAERTVLHWTRSSNTWTGGSLNPPGTMGGIFYAVSMPAPDDGWTIGTGGQFWHWNGTAWSDVDQFGNPYPSTGTRMLFTQLPNTREGWAVGNAGAVWRYISPVDPADLSVLKAADPATAAIGDTVTYTLTVTNNGPAIATGVVLTDSLPSRVSLLAATPTAGTCAGAQQVVCTLGTLNNGEQATVLITGEVVAGPPALATNTAVVAAQGADPNPANNSASATTTLFGAYLLRLPVVMK